MGDFSLSCGATGVSLMNDPVALIPLIKAENYDLNVDSGERGLASGAHLVTNDWVSAFYNPAALPIFGVMDSYGKLEEIEEDDNTRFIERITGVKIDEFAEYCSRGLRDDMDKGLASKVKAIKKAFGGPLRGMIVHRKAWDKMTTSLPGDFEGKPSWSMWDDLHGFSAPALEMIGFVERGETKDERYKRRFVHPAIRVTAMSDGRHSKFKFKGRTLEYIHSVGELARQLKRLGVTLPKEVCDMAKRTPGTLPRVMSGLLNPWAPPGPIKIYESEVLEINDSRMLKKMDEIDGTEESLSRARILGEVKVKMGFFLKGMASMTSFCDYLGSINRLLQPTWNGPQYGNHYAVSEIARLAASICEEKIERSKG